MVLTAGKYKISSRESSRFKELEFYQSLKVAHLLQSWTDGSVVTWGDPDLGWLTALGSARSAQRCPADSSN